MTQEEQVAALKQEILGLIPRLESNRNRYPAGWKEEADKITRLCYTIPELERLREVFKASAPPSCGTSAKARTA